jgi:hypothetical protein
VASGGVAAEPPAGAFHGGETGGPAGAGGTPDGTEAGGGAGGTEPPSNTTGGAAPPVEPSGGAAGTAGGAPAAEPPAPAPRSALITEYVEGNGNNKKALEIAARVAETLTGCKIEVFSNGATKASASWLLEGEVSFDAPLVLCTKELLEVPEARCTKQVALTFNGDDAVVLRCDDQLVDVIGEVGLKPPMQWGSDQAGTANMTLRRACTVQQGDPIGSDPFEPSLEWIPAGADEYSDLGRHCVE